MNEVWNRAFFAGFHGSDPFVASIPLEIQKEGNATSVGDGEVRYNRISTAFSMPLRSAEGMSVEEFIGMAAKMGSELGGERAKTFFQDLPASSPHSIAFEWDRPVSFDRILDIWEQMEIDFGEDGMPIWPKILLNSSGHAEFNEKFPKWQEDPECKRKWADLVERKRKEFHEREACRRLVD